MITGVVIHSKQLIVNAVIKQCKTELKVQAVPFFILAFLVFASLYNCMPALDISELIGILY